MRGFFWETTSGGFPYSSLVGSTVDTCLRQFTEALGFFLLFDAALVVDNGGMAGFATSRCFGIARCVPLVCRQAQDFSHHGRYEQVALHLPVEIPQVQFLDKVMMFSSLAPLGRLPGPR